MTTKRLAWGMGVVCALALGTSGCGEEDDAAGAVPALVGSPSAEIVPPAELPPAGASEAPPKAQELAAAQDVALAPAQAQASAHLVAASLASHNPHPEPPGCPDCPPPPPARTLEVAAPTPALTGR